MEAERNRVQGNRAGVEMLGARVPAGTKLLSRELDISS